MEYTGKSNGQANGQCSGHSGQHSGHWGVELGEVGINSFFWSGLIVYTFVDRLSACFVTAQASTLISCSLNPEP